jgi:hypothetical protein
MKNSKNVLVLIIVGAALLGFLLLYGRAFYLTLTQIDLPVFSDTYVYIANTLAGLVGGIVAIGFGQSPPPTSTGDLSLLSRNAVGVGNVITANRRGVRGPSTRSREVMGLVYSLAYVLMGLGAIIVWVADDKPPEIVKNLATLSIGLFLPIVTAFFKETEL